MTAAIPPRPSRKRVAGHHRPHTPHPVVPVQRTPEPEVQYVYVTNERRRFNGETVVGLVLSLLWLGGIGSAFGLWLGIRGVRACQRDNMSGEWAGHLSWIFGVVGILTTVAMIAGNS